MFSAFFYLLRARGLDISMKEWLTLIEALKLGLHGSSMKGFYNLCLAVLCKSEADYDRFGQAFLEFFNDGKIYDENGEVRSEYTQQMLEQMQQQMSQRGDFVAEQFSEEDVTEEDLAPFPGGNRADAGGARPGTAGPQARRRQLLDRHPRYLPLRQRPATTPMASGWAASA